MKKFLGVAFWLGLAGMGWAQAPAETTGPMAGSMSLQEIIQTGGWLMYVLAAMSILGLALILYFLIVMRHGQIAPERLARQLRQLVAAQKFQEARDLCARHRGPLPAVMLAALDYLKESPQPDPLLLKEIMEGEGSRQASELQNQIQYLLDIAAIAPMIGLLGTVVGMLKAFNAVALDLAKAKPMLLAAGVSQALITTVAGLVVAIPVMMAYAWFRGRVARLVGRLESISADLLTILVRKGP